ncbi:MAG: 30S ribosomal protein S7, partial [Chlorobium sp.]|nr:30S ribosomal protein S7 [Chlorobium sp.]
MAKKVVGGGVKPDLRFSDESVARLINAVMLDGKKDVAAKIVYGAMDIIAGKMKDEEPIEVFRRALSNVAPLVEVRSKRVGGATYQIPMEVKASRRDALAFRWIKLYATRRG